VDPTIRRTPSDHAHSADGLGAAGQPGEPTSAEPSLRKGLVSLVALYRSRLEIFLLDLEEEKERLELRLILTAVAAFLFGLGSLVLTAFFIALLWPRFGPWTIAFFAVLYLAGAFGAFIGLKNTNRDRHRTFACTLREFEKDAERFAHVVTQAHTSDDGHEAAHSGARL
jgi:uncharacterized membrane protein YqjE